MITAQAANRNGLRETAVALAVLARATIHIVAVSLRRPFGEAWLDRRTGEVWRR